MHGIGILAKDPRDRAFPPRPMQIGVPAGKPLVTALNCPHSLEYPMPYNTNARTNVGIAKTFTSEDRS